MGKTLMICAIIGSMLISGCIDDDHSIGIIGGADGPTAIFVGENTEVELIRMVKINGELYFESGRDTEMKIKPDVPDGKFKKGTEVFEIPVNDGEANFSDGSSWYELTENEIIIPVEGDLEIFKKLDTNTDISKYKYCYTVEGRLPNAKDDSELLVLSNDRSTTFEEASYKMIGADMSKMKDIYVLPITD